MLKIVIESPYKGDVEENVKYARDCMADSLKRGEAPIASHLLYTQEGILDDDIPEERQLGIESGLLWAREADKAVFYIDRGFTAGMTQALHLYQDIGTKIEIRTLYP